MRTEQMSDYRDREVVDRDTTVVREDRGSGLGTLLGILLVIALLIAVWYFTLGPGRGTVDVNSGGNAQPLPTVQAPAGGGGGASPAVSPAAS
jgi:hypothetical protein